MHIHLRRCVYVCDVYDAICMCMYAHMYAHSFTLIRNALHRPVSVCSINLALPAAGEPRVCALCPSLRQVLPGIEALDDAPPSTRDVELDLVLELLAHIEKIGGSEGDMRRVLVAAAAVKKQKI